MANHNPPTNGLDKRKASINRKGRPKSFDKLRELAQSIAHEEAQTGGKPLVIDGHIATVAEAILRQWAMSKDPRLVIAFVEYAFGKVPVKQENLNIDLDTCTPEEIKRIASGEDAAHVIQKRSTTSSGG